MPQKIDLNPLYTTFKRQVTVKLKTKKVKKRKKKNDTENSSSSVSVGSVESKPDLNTMILDSK